MTGESAEEEGAHGDVDHGFEDVEGALVVADQAAPADHPAEGPLHHPAPWKDLVAPSTGQCAIHSRINVLLLTIHALMEAIAVFLVLLP